MFPFPQLIMKCLLKLTKALPGLLPRLDAAAVLAEMDSFLARTPRTQEMVCMLYTYTHHKCIAHTLARA